VAAWPAVALIGSYELLMVIIPSGQVPASTAAGLGTSGASGDGPLQTRAAEVWRRAFLGARRQKESHACHSHRIRVRRIVRRGHHLHRRTIAPCAQRGCRRLRDCRLARWQEGRSFLSVKGVRDITSGLIAVILLTARMPRVLGWFELAGSTTPMGDAIIVLRSNSPKAAVYGVHGATAVVLLATAALLFT
jgi:hypothetical protein